MSNAEVPDHLHHSEILVGYSTFWMQQCSGRDYVALLNSLFCILRSTPARLNQLTERHFMGFLADMKILYHMLVKPVRGDSHAERMESFYGGQAKAYDDFRRRLLKGRDRLWQQLPKPENGTWVDMGGGTGANLEHFGDEVDKLKKIFVVDLSPSLLTVASDRFAKRGWNNVETVLGDATKFRPPDGPADVVTFSYSLTMIPDWFAAIENALAILKPGGHIGVVDFYVGRKHAGAELKQHRWLSRTLWTPWFSTDNVFPSPDHLPFLRHQFEQVYLEESRNRLPYVPLLRTPYYIFVGRKRMGLNNDRP